MAKETAEQKQQRLLMERAVRLTINLMAWLIRNSALSILGLGPRSQEILIMKWSYGLSLDQIAQNLSLSKERVRQLHDSAITKIYVRIPMLLTEYPEKKQLQDENKKLKQDNEMYKRMFDSLSDENKQKIHENDIRSKGIEDIDFSTRTFNVLAKAGIRTINDLLQYTTTALFTNKGFTARTMIEVEAFLHEHRLQIRRE